MEGRRRPIIVVGGGTAGSVLAERLGEDPNLSVALSRRAPIPTPTTRLLRSGIGPADHLAEHGRKVRADLPVGSTMSDHLGPGIR